MLKVEEKYHERIETKSPSRTQNHHQFDNNLDYLLEDLQNSISRPGSISTEHYRHASPTRVTSLRPANPLVEYSADDSYTSTGPDGSKNLKTVKKEMYSYQTSSNNSGIPRENPRMRNNINELDSLLDDLQQVKQSPDKIPGGQNYREYSKSKIISGKTVVENVYPVDAPPLVSSTSTTTKSYVSGNAEEPITREFLNEGTYGNIKTTRTTSATPPPPPSSKTNTLTKQTKITNVHTYPVEVVETSAPEMNSEILASLDPNLLPTGNTKVTTTIKTYTYEIPGTVLPSSPTNASVDSTDKYVYSLNESQTTPSKSFVYNKYEKDSLAENYAENRYQRPPQSPPLSDESRRVITEREVTTSRNYQPATTYSTETYGRYRDGSLTRSTGSNTSPQEVRRRYPSTSDDKNVVKETIVSRNYQPGNVYVDSSGKHTYMYNESTLTRTQGTNTDRPTSESPVPRQQGPYPGGRPGSPLYDRTVIVHNTNIETRGRPPPQPSPYNNNSSYSGKYRTETNYDENKPLLNYPPPTGRFPTDGDAPPKKLDELMATIGNEPPNSALNAGYNAHEVELAQQKKVETLKMQQKDAEKDDQKKLQHTKNVTGPPVYYPPGHEMFASKSEASGGGWRAEGAMAKESGKYKYESGSKSSSKTKAAVVPVCLPLCCGLPCTIL